MALLSDLSDTGVSLPCGFLKDSNCLAQPSSGSRREEPGRMVFENLFPSELYVSYLTHYHQHTENPGDKNSASVWAGLIPE